MPSLKIYDLFISHAWDYSEAYNRLVSFLDSAPNFTYRNYSRPKERPLIGNSSKDFCNMLSRQINPVNIVIILSGMYAHHSDWIQWEINYAKSMRKPIIGIVPWAQERTPLKVQEAVTEMVAWNATSIIQAIRRHSL